MSGLAFLLYLVRAEPSVGRRNDVDESQISRKPRRADAMTTAAKQQTATSSPAASAPGAFASTQL